MKAAEIGRRFVDYFVKQRGHSEVPSASLLYNDPTLLFVNAGMVPFKPYFVGEEPSPYQRAASIQKCVRTLDIDEVGKTTRHGTFFQMLGNFSFNDYFKKEAIEWGWELVTTPWDQGGFGFDPDKIWVTVLGPGCHPDYPQGDIDAKKFWMGVGIPEHRIQARSLKDNYWHMGVPGPGGPCSEIYVDRGPSFGPDGGPDADEDRYLEIWNLVFQTESLTKVRAKDDFDIEGPLASKNIDTGAGLERIAYLLQGVDNMYEIDEVYPVIEKACEMSGKKYHANWNDDVRFRVVADHVRSGLMLMTDGVTPGNEGRGFVLRRLLRRVILSMRLLGYQDPVLGELLPVSKELMHTTYPDIDTQWDRVIESAKAEEESFRRTLKQGLSLFDMAVKDTKAKGENKLAGDRAFALHDTYGFPISLTLEMAEDQGLTVDQEGFKKLMEEQRARAKADSKAKKGGTVAVEAYRQLREQGETNFVGYTELAIPTKVVGIINNDKLVNEAPAGSIVEVVLEQTPFYAESGGQDSDAGQILTSTGALEVLDVQSPVQGLVVHKVKVGDGVHLGQQVQAEVDAAHRLGSCQAHSATHLVHAALRELVGKGATQAGSYNKPGYLRFDFSSQHGLSAELKKEIEQRVNQAIADNLEVSYHHMKLEEAKALGAMAMFGEKYPPVVRMVEMGGAWSRELCGGTHVGSTSQIGLLSLLGEQSVGSGVRRVEALVSTDAFNQLAAERALVANITDILKVQPDQLTARITKLVADLKEAQKTISDLKTAQLLAGVDQLVNSATQIGDVWLATQSIDGASGNELRNYVMDVRNRFGSKAAVVAVCGGTKEKPSLIVATTQGARDLGCKAGELVRVGAEILGGRGGGKDDLAQGGGTDGGAKDKALGQIKAELVRKFA